MLLIFAWSSVYFDLNAVYTQVTRLVLDVQPPRWAQAASLEHPLDHPAIGWDSVQAVAEKVMAEQAREHGFTVGRTDALYLDRASGTYEYRVHSSRDVDERHGSTSVYFDANTGAFKELSLPAGQYSGDTVTSWLVALHMAAVFGMPYRIFVCGLGLVIVMLSVTGIVIWLRKRRSKQYRAKRGEHMVSPETLST